MRRVGGRGREVRKWVCAKGVFGVGGVGVDDRNVNWANGNYGMGWW